MNDAYPPTFDIEIDREPLTRYLRAQHQLIWFYLTLFAGVFVGILSAAKFFESHAALPWTTNLWTIGWRFLWIILAFQLCGLIACVLSIRTIQPYVDGLLLTVEGPFLRIRKTLGGVERDRKYHFRLLHVYSTKQDARMRKLGISALVITSSVGLEATRTIEVPAVKNCLKVRDMLAEIDSQRENS